MKVCGYTLFIIWITSISSAETVLFKNGDRIKATSVEQTNDLLRITSERFGTILIAKMNCNPLHLRLPKNHPPLNLRQKRHQHGLDKLAHLKPHAT